MYGKPLTTRVLDAFALALVRAVLAFKRQDLFLSLFNSWDESTFSLQDNSPSEVLSSLVIPLCKAAAIAGDSLGPSYVAYVETSELSLIESIRKSINRPERIYMSLHVEEPDIITPRIQHWGYIGPRDET